MIVARKARALGAWVAVAVTFLITSSAPAASAPPPVPAAHRELYERLERILDARATELAGTGAGHEPGRPRWSVELAAANANRGPALLHPTTMDVVRRSLDRFRQMGIRIVKFALHYPLLRPDFPDAPAYLAFYKEVVREARSREIDVMPHVTVLFADTPFSPFRGLYAELDLARFRQEYRAMVHRVVAELRPEYLVLLTEPDTHARLTRLAALNQPEVVADVVRFALDGLSRGTTRIGAGSGSWSPPAFAEAIVERTDVDFLAIHIYPITGTMLPNAARMARIARGRGRQVIIDEAWLYKTLRPGGGSEVAATSEIFRLDVFSFWQPLDRKFITTVARLAAREEVSVVSLFWSGLLFGYLDYAPALDQVPYGELTRRHNEVVFRNLSGGALSETGELVRQLAGGRP